MDKLDIMDKMVINIEGNEIINISETSITVNDQPLLQKPFSVFFSPAAESVNTMDLQKEPHEGLCVVIFANGGETPAYISRPIVSFTRV